MACFARLWEVDKQANSNVVEEMRRTEQAKFDGAELSERMGRKCKRYDTKLETPVYFETVGTPAPARSSAALRHATTLL